MKSYDEWLKKRLKALAKIQNALKIEQAELAKNNLKLGDLQEAIDLVEVAKGKLQLLKE